jgi:hypothetical protein
MRPSALRPLGPVAIALSLAAGACAPDAPTAPASGVTPLASAHLAARPGTDGLLACPASSTTSAEAVIGTAGGRVEIDGHALVVPAGAVRKDTRFVLTVPASPVLEIDVSADGRRAFRFHEPVQVRISYARCAEAPAGDLVGRWIDGGTRLDMPTVHDAATQSIVITTEHLSGYAIAYRGGRGTTGDGEGEGDGR